MEGGLDEGVVLLIICFVIVCFVSVCSQSVV